MSQERQIKSNNPEENSSTPQSKIKESLNLGKQHLSKREAKNVGLSEDFKEKLLQNNARSEEQKQAEKICEQAMVMLSTQYIQLLESFKVCEDASLLPSLIEKAETIWQTETQKILQFDKAGSQQQFFNEMRNLYFMTLNNKSEELARKAIKEPSTEKINAMRAILTQQDSILAELGHPKDSLERLHIREVLTGFKN